jgi:hypothetical protein
METYAFPGDSEDSDEYWEEPLPVCDEGEFVVEAVVGSMWATHGSFYQEEYADSVSPQRWEVKWKGYGSEDNTFECLENFYKTPAGRYPDIEEYQKTVEAEARHYQAFKKRDAKCTMHTARLLHTAIKAQSKPWSVDPSRTSFPNVRHTSQTRVVLVPCDRERFRMMTTPAPKWANKISATK